MKLRHREQAAISENRFRSISLWQGVVVLKSQYIRAERTSKRIALKKYFTLGGCFGTERPIHLHTSRENKQENSFK